MEAAEFPGARSIRRGHRTCLARGSGGTGGHHGDRGGDLRRGTQPGVHLTVHHARIADEEQELNEHDELRWVHLDQLDDLKMSRGQA